MRNNFSGIVLGASAGGISSMRTIIAEIPAFFQLPLILVQHIHRDNNIDVSLVFNHSTKITVKEAEDKEEICGGTLYVAPPGYHLLVEKNLILSLSKDELVNFSRPSIDVLFETAAEAFGNQLVGVVLSGANRDGAKGLKAIKQAGGLAVVEDPDTAESPVMPRAAIEEVGTENIDFVLPAIEIGTLLATMGKRRLKNAEEMTTL